MSITVIIADSEGERTLSEHELPVSIGTSADAGMRIPGPIRAQALAQVGLLDGRPFVQVPGRGDVRVNDEAVASTRWLADGDTLEIDGTRIDVSLASTALRLKLVYAGAEYKTAPPLPGAEVGVAAEPIAPGRRRAKPKDLAHEQRQSHSHSRRWVYAGLAVLLSAAIYMFTSVTVVIRAEQENAVITLPGSWLTPGGDGRYLLWPGKYRVRIEAPGYLPLEDVVTVSAGARAEFSFGLEEMPGRLTVVTDPVTDGEVWIDGAKAGALQGEPLLLAGGTYELRVKTERFLDYVGQVEVSGRDIAQTVEPVLTPNWAEITVSSEPDGAEVVSDDEVLGVTPATIELVAGTRELLLRKPGYRTERRALGVVAGQAETLPTIQLEESGAILQVTSKPSGAAVTVGGEFAGNTPVEIEVAKGASYRVQLSKAGYTTATRTVPVEESVEIPVSVDLAAQTGVLTIAAEPSDAVLYVNGREMGAASQELELIAVPQRLEIRKAGFEAWSREVTPKPGLPQRIDVRLLTPAEAKLAAVPATWKTSQGQVMRLIPPGEFTMGAPRREQGRRPNEVRRKVVLSRSFYVSQNEVTNAEFRKFLPSHTSGAEKYRELAADKSPAVMMSWEQAVEYCNWLSDGDGLAPAYVREGGRWILKSPVTDGYRLPTEAEWAWVARFGGGAGELKYPWGSAMPPADNSGNYADSSAVDVAAGTIGSYTDGYPVTAPVGSFPPNAAGINDLGGNVAEWVHDYLFGIRGRKRTASRPAWAYLKGSIMLFAAPVGGQSSISELRLAYRDFGDRGRLDVGFRLARYSCGARISRYTKGRQEHECA